MIKNKLIKFLSATVAAITLTVIAPINAHAEWKSDSNGYWYTQGNGWVTGWKKIDNKWYYFDDNGYMHIGWLNYNGKWYYLDYNGEMVRGDVIDGYAINNDGIWINDYKYNIKEAEKLMFKKDGNFVNKLLKENRYVIREIGTQVGLKNNYGISERVYGFYFENDYFGPTAVEFVGMDTGKVYRAEGPSGTPVKRIENNKEVQTYKYKE